MILKFRKNISEWYSLYANAIKNRLRRDLNLSDVCDVQETRDNIGLSGDNNHTHYHDDRYIPIIEKRINELDNKVNNLIPIGTIMTWPSNVPPDTYRWLECNGQSFNPTEFPDLYKVFPSGRVPDLREKFLEGYRIAGNDISPGLPGWYHWSGNHLTTYNLPGDYTAGGHLCFMGGGNMTQGGGDTSSQYFQMIEYISIGNATPPSTTNISKQQTYNIPINVSGTVSTADGTYSVNSTGTLPVTIGTRSLGVWQDLVMPTLLKNSKYYYGYKGNNNKYNFLNTYFPSDKYIEGHELYGESATVQPKSYTVNFYVRAK